MGQRHQIYLRLPKTENRPAVVVGIHNQWLWGVSALASLSRFLMFAVANLEETYPVLHNGRSDESLEILASCYAVSPQTGFYSRIHKLDEDSELTNWLQNPDMGDNNNGITLIDLSCKKPKYCFMSIHHLECLNEAIDKQQELAEETVGPTADFAFRDFDPMDAEKWISLHYSTKELKKYDGYDKKPLELIKFVSKFEVMTVTDCCNMFPALKAKFRATAKAKSPKKAKAKSPRKTAAKLQLA